MGKYYCNPINMEYRYQMFRVSPKENRICEIHREAADPTILFFRDRYWLFPSMSGGFYTSGDLTGWEFHEFQGDFPVYDYAPDACVMGEYLYLCATSEAHACSFYRTRDPLTEPFEEIPGEISFHDPAVFCDDDGRVYLYWGSSNAEPIWGVELDPDTMRPLGEKQAMMDSDCSRLGYERMGEDYIPPKTREEIEESIRAVMAQYADRMPAEGQSGEPCCGTAEKGKEAEEPDQAAMMEKLYRWFGNSPYMEGPWMTKHQGRYYLQYAVTGTEYNVYADGVYVSDHPLGPFVPAKNNPYSYKPGGFITAAGHGSTFPDRERGFWHVATMRISENHSFERRLGLWRADFDEEGELCCNQRYGDWPIRTDAGLWDDPDWMLLSFGKPVTASSGKDAGRVTDEDIRTWWQADTADLSEWIEVDLQRPMDVRAVQINFADHWTIEATEDMEFLPSWDSFRHLDSEHRRTRWILEGSADGIHYETLADKSGADTDLSHDLTVMEEGRRLRFVRLKSMELPFAQQPCVSGLRVFGLGEGEKPGQVACFSHTWGDDAGLDLDLSWEPAKGAVGYCICWGYHPRKLYHSYLVYRKTSQRIGALISGSPLYVRIDAFNESGITEGKTQNIRG